TATRQNVLTDSTSCRGHARFRLLVQQQPASVPAPGPGVRRTAEPGGNPVERAVPAGLSSVVPIDRRLPVDTRPVGRVEGGGEEQALTVGDCGVQWSAVGCMGAQTGRCAAAGSGGERRCSWALTRRGWTKRDGSSCRPNTAMT